MKTFLETVAADMLGKFGNNMSKVAVVFPNKRAALFMNDYLAQQSDKPVWAPAYITISDLFRNHSQRTVPDQLKLVCELHKCFVKTTGTNESLDHFFGWGLLMLADFDDLDKNMADARQVFANIKDIHEYDNVDYLTDSQKETLKTFFSNFTDDKNTELKKRFMNIWSKFYEIYSSFNKQLEQQGLAYEGALYREVAENKGIEFEHDKYVFVGFNMMQKAEKLMLEKIQECGKAEFYWDYDSYYASNQNKTQHEAGHYIMDNIRHFGTSMDYQEDGIYDNLRKQKQITFISSTTEDMQARYAGNWLKENDRDKAGRKTAIVMCNEKLMQTLIYSLPNELPAINITSGYPLQQTPVASLIGCMMELRCEGFRKNKECFTLSYVNRILNHPFITYISDGYKELLNQLNGKSKVYYPSPKALAADNNLATLFSHPYEKCSKTEGVSFELDMVSWMIKVIRIIAENTQDCQDPLLKESLYKSYTLLNRIESLIENGDLNVTHITLKSLINQIVQNTNIPFHGEPAEGIQIMGVLETRNLDFDNLLILSCNEGNMPKGVNDTSFIPYSIRKAFDLTTIDNKVAIYAYYFYRLIQRANDITFVYNNATTDGNKNEMSRFLMQLMVESGQKINHKTFCSQLEVDGSTLGEIQKNDKVMKLLRKRFDTEANDSKRVLLTPTALNLYLRCPIRFYYNYVCNIKEPDFNDEDKIDGRLFGNIFHTASEIIYKRLMDKDGCVKPTYISNILKAKGEIEKAVDEAFKNELFKNTLTKPEYNGLQLINKEVIVIYLRRVLENDIKLGEFKILGLEKQVSIKLKIMSGNDSFTTTLGGFIDRLDRVSDNNGMTIRVIDYKTGKNSLGSFNSIDDLFMADSVAKHSDYYLQTMLYSVIVSNDPQLNTGNFPVSASLMFIQQNIENKDDIILNLNKQPISDIKVYENEFKQKVETLIAEIFNPDMPFRPTPEEKHCAYCPYAKLCNS